MYDTITGFEGANSAWAMVSSTKALLALSLCLCGTMLGQPQTNRFPDTLPVGAMRWGKLLPKLTSLGDRITKPGKERLTLDGTLTEAGKPASAIVVTVQLPGLVNVDRANKQKIGFGGNGTYSAVGKLETLEEDLLETFLQDTQEGFLRAKLEGAYTVLFGEGFRIDGKTTGPYSLPYYDVYEQTVMVKSKKGAPRTKIFLFNSATGLLEFVRYKDFTANPPLSIETQWTWGKSGTETTPIKLTRRERGAVVWEIQVSNSAVAAKAPEANFRP